MYGVLEAISRCHFPYPVTSLGHSQRKKPRYQEASTLAQGHRWQRQEETSLVTGLRYSPGALAQACPFPRCPGSCPISHFQLLGFISRILVSLSSINSPTPALSFPSAKATPIYSCLDGPGSLSPSSFYSFSPLVSSSGCHCHCVSSPRTHTDHSSPPFPPHPTA